MSSIFCLEGEWGRYVRSRETVLPLLELLDRLDEASFYHRDVATSEELTYYLKKLDRLSTNTFPVLYLACHGEEEHGEIGIYLGGATLSLGVVGELLERKLAGRILYFGSCLVGSASDEQIQDLARVTGARGIVGYETEVDWLESASFDLLLLPRLVRAKRMDAIFNGLLKHNSSMSTALGLVVATKAKVLRTGKTG